LIGFKLFGFISPEDFLLFSLSLCNVVTAPANIIFLQKVFLVFPAAKLPVSGI
jgi:hypothetical protein